MRGCAASDATVQAVDHDSRAAGLEPVQPVAEGLQRIEQGVDHLARDQRVEVRRRQLIPALRFVAEAVDHVDVGKLRPRSELGRHRSRRLECCEFDGGQPAQQRAHDAGAGTDVEHRGSRRQFEQRPQVGKLRGLVLRSEPVERLLPAIRRRFGRIVLGRAAMASRAPHRLPVHAFCPPMHT